MLTFAGIAAPVRLDRQPQHLLRALARVPFVELDVGGAGDLGDGHSRDDRSVVALRHLGQAGHDALVVHHDGVDRAGDQRQLLRQGVGGIGDAVAHQQLVAGAADAHQVEPAGRTCSFGLALQPLRFGQDHLAEHGVVAVHRDVDRVDFQTAEVGAAQHRCWGAEQNIGEVGAQVHAGVVADRALDRAQQDVDRVGVHAVGGAVHHLGHAGIEACGDQPELLELRKAFGGHGRLEPDRRVLSLGELGQGQARQLAGQLLVALAVALRCQRGQARHRTWRGP